MLFQDCVKLDLNNHIQNRNGVFDVLGGSWKLSAKDGAYIKGSTLFASLRDRQGKYLPETWVNLNMFISNTDGALKFGRKRQLAQVGDISRISTILLVQRRVLVCIHCIDYFNIHPCRAASNHCQCPFRI